MTDAVAARLALSGFQVTPRGSIDLKGIGQVATSFVREPILAAVSGA